MPFNIGDIVQVRGQGRRLIIISDRETSAALMDKLPAIRIDGRWRDRSWRMHDGDDGYEVMDMPGPNERPYTLAYPTIELSLVTNASLEDRAAAAEKLAEHRAGSGTKQADEPRVPVDITRW